MKAITPKPVNVMVRHGPILKDLVNADVRRVSGAVTRAVWAAVLAAMAGIGSRGKPLNEIFAKFSCGFAIETITGT